MRVRLRERVEDGRSWPVLVWAPGPGWRMIATGVLGGGLGERPWWLNAMVSRVYHDPEPAQHAREIAAALGLLPGRPPSPDPDGVGLLTAADVSRWRSATCEGVEVAATVGLGVPTWASASDVQLAAETAAAIGTINLLVVVPAALSDAALVNAVITVTEAKAQALGEAGVPGTGTSSDAVCIACPVPSAERPAHPYGGPRSEWGLRMARAVHAAVAAGTADWLALHPDGDEHRRWARTGLS